MFTLPCVHTNVDPRPRHDTGTEYACLLYHVFTLTLTLDLDMTQGQSMHVDVARQIGKREFNKRERTFVKIIEIIDFCMLPYNGPHNICCD